MRLKLKNIVALALIAALMCVGDFAMEWLPNIHFVGVLIVISTVVYRKYALLSIGVYVLIQGIMCGFSMWWIPYIYVWTILWGAIMLIPQKLSEKVKYVLYIIFCTMHGLLFGILYAPWQVIMFGLDLKGALAWVAAGIYFDLLHGAGNFVLGTLLIYPMTKILRHSGKYI